MYFQMPSGVPVKPPENQPACKEKSLFVISPLIPFVSVKFKHLVLRVSYLSFSHLMKCLSEPPVSVYLSIPVDLSTPPLQQT